MLSDLFFHLILAIIFGATIGLERESSRQNESHVGSVGGIRTFALIALLGALAGIFFIHDYSTLAIIVVLGFLLLLIVYYASESYATRSFGITSELSAVITFFMSLMVMIEIIPLPVTVSVFVVLVFYHVSESQDHSIGSWNFTTRGAGIYQLRNHRVGRLACPA